MRKAVLAALMLACASTAFAWTDNPLTPGTTLIRKVHIDELRTAINGKRSDFGMSAYSFTHPTIPAGSTLVRAVHITDLRTAVTQLDNTYNPVCPAVVPAAPAWTDATLTAGGTLVRAVHITELRSAVDAIGTCAA